MKKKIVASFALALGLVITTFAQNPATTAATTTTPAKVEKHAKMKEKAATADAATKPVVTPKGVKKHHKKHKKHTKKTS